ncbi:phosphohistidine phosphatase SixA [Fluviicoccus keumensis]|uniref:Phosphohistidine phosphatase SixA n=1 Tax=Fluviicoccus keumensis TaxID=1435465 RepID=A0A4Q7YKP1_9GAMM|nr:phosphohistidine phosphatase SixA [Fluviicoccus keumensis]RZU37079.1 phosphohistidine phosphatase SixA [Fluviicoccus keumensis]
MQIILIRHGEAEPMRRTDAERNLTLNGLHQAQQAAAWLINHGVSLDGLFASPYYRARQTAGEIGNVLDVPVTLTDRITPDRDPREITAWLDSLDLPENSVIALVCHMPVVGLLAAYWCEGGGSTAFSLAEVMVLDMPVLAAGQGSRTGGFVPH